MANNNQKVHVIADESLGGVMREFVEVDRKAVVGDYVVDCSGGVNLTAGKIYTISGKLDSAIDGHYGMKFIDDKGRGRAYWTTEQYRVLEPTDIVQIYESDDYCGMNMRYRLVEREAKVGEKAVVVDAQDLWYANGQVFTVIERWSGDSGKAGVDDDEGTSYFDSEYRVLEPVKPNLADLLSRITPENRHEEVSFGSPDITDLLANLARRVNSLESQLSDTQRNVERQDEEIARLRYLGASNEEDIRTLDSRTQVVSAIQDYYGGASR